MALGMHAAITTAASAAAAAAAATTTKISPTTLRSHIYAATKLKQPTTNTNGKNGQKPPNANKHYQYLTFRSLQTPIEMFMLCIKMRKLFISGTVQNRLRLQQWQQQENKKTISKINDRGKRRMLFVSMLRFILIQCIQLTLVSASRNSFNSQIKWF